MMGGVTTTQRFRAVIAGGGVAGLEALLALRDLAGDRVEIELLAPNEAFEFRPLLVAEPFGLELSTEVDLAPIVAEAGAHHRRERLAAVDSARRVVHTESGTEVPYDALLVALGARPVEAVPGALAFAGPDERGRFRELLRGLGRRGSERLAFVVPSQATWAIAAYELALLSAAERAARRLEHAELVLVTHERAPLELFGAPASQLVAAKLEEAGIELRTGAEAVAHRDGALELRDGEPVACDHAVTLPALEVPMIEGLPQRARGFVETDVRMHVSGQESVWAAGDVTSFPIKQGGLAAQQADIAARSIAVRAGVHVPLETFRPVLRAALISGGGLEFLRSGDSEERAAGARALWWPPTKIAGAYLGPRLAESAGERVEGTLVDLERSDDPEADEAERRAALDLVLTAADADARSGSFEDALRLLGLVEQLDLVLPPDYVVKRYEWRRSLDPSLAPDEVTKRIEPTYASAEAGISDLRRRLGWLREIESRSERDMSEHLAQLDAGFERLRSLARETGTDRHSR
jgi:sulfide:quinone oxidoreductase